MSDLLIRPRLTELEAAALQRMLGDVRRFAHESGRIRAVDVPRAVSAIDNLVRRLEPAFRTHPSGTDLLIFDEREAALLDSALRVTLDTVRTDGVYLLAFLVDRDRARLLRDALQLERGIVGALASVTDPVMRDRIVELMSVAQDMRRARRSIYNGVSRPADSPEIALLTDALALGIGSENRSVLGGDVAAAHAAYAADVHAASGRNATYRMLRPSTDR